MNHFRWMWDKARHHKTTEQRKTRGGRVRSASKSSYAACWR